MATGESVSSPQAQQQRQSVDGRWFQFRLKTLFILPILLVFLQRLTTTDLWQIVGFDLVVGAIWGSLWAIGRIYIVGLRQSGLRRVGPVLWSAASGGVTAGMIAGIIGIWVALARDYPFWHECFLQSRNAHWLTAAYELTTAGLFGSFLGAVFGAWGALIVGPTWSYLALAARGRTSTDGPGDNSESSASESTVAAKQALRQRIGRSLLVIGCVVGLLGFPALIAWNGCLILHDWQMVRRLKSAGWDCGSYDFASMLNYDGPRFLSKRFDNEYLPLLFGRVKWLTVQGTAHAKAIAALQHLDSVDALAIVCTADDHQLLGLGAALQRLPRLRQQSLQLNLEGNQFTEVGVEILVQQVSPWMIMIDDEVRGANIVNRFSQSPLSTGPQKNGLFVSTRYAGTIVGYEGEVPGSSQPQTKP